MTSIPVFFKQLSITSVGFFLFILAVFCLYYIVPKRAQNVVLLLSSYLFCWSWDWTFTVIVFVFSMATFLLAIQIEKTEGRTRQRWLILAIVSCLATLVFFKYFVDLQVFITRTLNFLKLPLPPILFLRLLPPLGISFYVLQAISYLVDVYRKQIPGCKSFIAVSLYLAYFPKLLAGPIERAGPFFEQIHASRIIDNSVLTESFLRIFVGLLRKIVIADMVVRIIPWDIFTRPGDFPFIDLFFWWVVFAFVIYNDFAGYSGIARGVSGLFGIQLSPNFEQPFFSTSYIDFWNRWHISLSNWLRDYIYIPVSRALLRQNPSRKYWPNLIIPSLATMLVSGLWHGLNPQFLFWGLLNGSVQALERFRKIKKTRAKLPRVLMIIITITTLLFINVPFKLDPTQSFEFWMSVFNWTGPQTLEFAVILKPLFGIGMSIFIDLLYLPLKDEKGLFNLSRNTQIALLTIGMFLLFLATRQPLSAPFIYQEF